MWQWRDPIYSTVGILLIAVSLYHRESAMRRKLTTLMMAFCIGYMALTFVNKYYIDQIFEETLQKEGIVAKRYMTILPYSTTCCGRQTAETDSAYFGSYSHF